LVLVPTGFERERLLALGGHALPDPKLCGFGPIAAAARTAELLAKERAARVILLGIAGSFDQVRAPLASARVFARVRLDGLGAGEGRAHRTSAELGFAQWSEGDVTIHDRLEVGGGEGELLTVCAAAATEEEAQARRARYPEALGEDMEGFGVALACQLARVELVIVRGFSNRAGDRERARWRIDEALRAARALALECLARPGARNEA
jgi:futalosine hydrolase